MSESTPPTPIARAREVFPVPRLGNDLLVLRPFSLADVPVVAEACSDAETQRWLPLPTPYTADVAVQWCDGLAEDLRIAGDGLNLAFVDSGGEAPLAPPSPD